MAKAETADRRQHQRSKPAHRGIRWRPVFQPGSRSHNPSCSKMKMRNLSPTRSPEASESNLAVFIPYSRSEDLATRVFQVLQCTAGKGNDILALGEYLPEVLARIGCNSALDTALEALLLAHQGKMLDVRGRDEGAQAEIYGRALLALSEHINAEQAEPSTETVCAAISLCTVEVGDLDVGQSCILADADL